MTEVLPLPAAATTRLQRSSTTTALRCSAVSGRASIRSNNARERTSSFATNASLAFARASSGASRNARIPRSIRISRESNSDFDHHAANPPTAVCASCSRSRSASVVRYFGGSTRSVTRSWTVRSVPICAVRAWRHHSRLAVSSASARALAAIRGRPETCESPAGWRIRMLNQQRPSATWTASTSPKGMSWTATRTVSASTDAPQASRGRRIANRSEVSPVRFASRLIVPVPFQPTCSDPARVASAILGNERSSLKSSNFCCINAVSYPRANEDRCLYIFSQLSR